MKPIEPYLEHAFRIDPKTGAPVVEIAVEHYDDLFNTLDRAPYRRRDLSPDLKQFLRECSTWIPLPQPFAIEFKVSRDRRDDQREKEVVAGIRNYFAYLTQVIRTEVRLQRKKIAAFVALSFFFLTMTLVLGRLLDASRIFSAFLLNGLTVGGWVFMWEALSIAFIRRLDVGAELARHDRLVRADILFTFEERS
ncbi:MAG: hypothetical protein HY698_21110 [Deltaproteobacteria bacterium]|nr:hypothetical protein [Deltaproteobacteria bacterium]